MRHDGVEWGGCIGGLRPVTNDDEEELARIIGESKGAEAEARFTALCSGARICSRAVCVRRTSRTKMVCIQCTCGQRQ